MKPKEIESKAYDVLKAYVAHRLPEATLEPVMNKKRGQEDSVGDAILWWRQDSYHIEIKASAHDIDSNIRFAHQTIGKAKGQALIVALISKLSTNHPEVRFINLAAYSEAMIVEPTFILRKSDIDTDSPELADLLEKAPSSPCDFSFLFGKKVAQFTYPNNPKVQKRGKTV